MNAKKKHIYKVEGPQPDETRLVRAPNSAQAIRYCIGKDYSASYAEQDEIAALVARGVRVEEAKDEG